MYTGVDFEVCSRLAAEARIAQLTGILPALDYRVIAAINATMALRATQWHRRVISAIWNPLIGRRIDRIRIHRLPKGAPRRALQI